MAAKHTELITDVSITISKRDYIDTRQVMSILKGYSTKEVESHFQVEGSYEEMEDAFMKLSTLKLISTGTMHNSPNHQYKDFSVTIKPVEVAGDVMAYIEKTHSKELQRIQGSNVTIETQPSKRTAPCKHSGNMMVTFKYHNIEPVHVRFVRERFITFYQRMASDMQVKSVTIDPVNYQALQASFPKLLIKASRGKPEATVTGPFTEIASLEYYIKHNTSRPTETQSPRRRSPTHTTNRSMSRNQPDEDEQCAICLDDLKTDIKTLPCKHSFCKDCINRAFELKPACPTCGVLYGTLKGTQPDGGRMDVTYRESSLPGYENYGTIVIKYYIPDGIQKEEHPHPGQRFEGASRTAYLPNSSRGKKVLELLRRAFNQRLIFTIGRSSTTGRNNLVTWNDIHHKTSTHGGPICYGYPDPDYLNRVEDELKIKGIE